MSSPFFWKVTVTTDSSPRVNGDIHVYCILPGRSRTSKRPKCETPVPSFMVAWKWKSASTLGSRITRSASHQGVPGFFRSSHASNASAGEAGIVRLSVISIVFILGVMFSSSFSA